MKFALNRGDYRDPQVLKLQRVSAHVLPVPTARSAAQTLHLGLRRKTAKVGGPGGPLLDDVFQTCQRHRIHVSQQSDCLNKSCIRQKPADMSTQMGKFPKVPALDEELQAINEDT